MSEQASKADKIWFTRCPVPTATGLAYKLGWLTEEFAKDGIALQTLQDTPELRHHHYSHGLTTLIREGGNLLAIPARAQGAQTRLVGLTWIDEAQSILVRPGSGITEPKHLKGLRAALPAYNEADIQNNTRGRSIARGMALHGFKGALEYAGLRLDDVRFVEIPNERVDVEPQAQQGPTRVWTGLQYLIDGKVDAVYLKGAASVEAARKFGAVVGVNLDLLPEKRFRVNNGTPRPITAHESLIEHHFDLIVRFLDTTLRAADFASDNIGRVRSILESETRAGSEGVTAAYSDASLRSLHPDLSPERVELFRQQKNFQLLHGIIERDFDFDAWIDPRPLEAAQKLRSARLAAQRSRASTGEVRATV
jgi:ABC-type nitrate/sulfonate/bicarbonate transport system substrate-binding protein